LWVNKKQKLQARYRILNFKLNIKQVSSGTSCPKLLVDGFSSFSPSKKKVYVWLENHGEVFLRKNYSVGKNLSRAKMLHLSHENFVKVLKASFKMSFLRSTCLSLVTELQLFLEYHNKCGETFDIC
jgi:hypothetical protein